MAFAVPLPSNKPFRRVAASVFIAAFVLACSDLFGAVPAVPDDEATWTRLDWTQDGWLDGKELENGKWLKFDTDRNGEVTRAEFLAGNARERQAGVGAQVLPDRGAVRPPVLAPAQPKPTIIEAFWGNKWSKAHIIEKSVDPNNPQAGPQNKVHYEGSWNYFDEWVAVDKLRTLDGSPLPAPTPTADDLAVADRVKLSGTAFFVGTWSLGGVPVMNVVDREKTGDGKTIRETRQMQGGGGRGYLRINADGTFVWAGGPGGKSSGPWHIDTGKNREGGLVLEKADRVIGDAYVGRRQNAMISVMKGLGGPTSIGAPVWDDTDLLLVASVGPEFYYGKWKLNRQRSSTLLKSDYGLLEIRTNGTFTHVDAGKTTAGNWAKADQGDGLVLHNPWGEGDFRVEQDGATAGIRSQGVQQTHIGVYGQRPDAE